MKFIKSIQTWLPHVRNVAFILGGVLAAIQAFTEYFAPQPGLVRELQTEDNQPGQ